jgi:hypothetical protein
VELEITGNFISEMAVILALVMPFIQALIISGLIRTFGPNVGDFKIHGNVVHCSRLIAFCMSWHIMSSELLHEKFLRITQKHQEVL